MHQTRVCYTFIRARTTRSSLISYGPAVPKMIVRTRRRAAAQRRCRKTRFRSVRGFRLYFQAGGGPSRTRVRTEQTAFNNVFLLVMAVVVVEGPNASFSLLADRIRAYVPTSTPRTFTGLRVVKMARRPWSSYPRACAPQRTRYACRYGNDAPFSCINFPRTRNAGSNEIHTITCFPIKRFYIFYTVNGKNLRDTLLR